MTGNVRFTSDEVARLVSMARSMARGRTPEQRIEEFLDRLGELIPHGSCNVMTIDPRAGVVPVHAKTLSIGDLADYGNHYRFKDPMGHCLTTVLDRGLILSDFATPRQVDRTEFADLLGRKRLRHLLGTTVALTDGRLFALAIQRFRGEDDFGERERALFELAIPILGDAFEGDQRGGSGVLALLTPRELDVARLAATGLGDREIARRLGIRFSTVRTHLQRSFAKLEVSNRTELARRLNGRD